jgi:hypothetical protein
VLGLVPLDDASACSAPVISFRAAIRASHGAILLVGIGSAVHPRDSGVFDLKSHVHAVVRGPAAVRIPRALAGSVCDGIDEGQVGYLVRDVDHPDLSPHSDLFYAAVEGGRSLSGMRKALAEIGLPATDVESARTPAPWVAVAAGLVAFGVVLRRRAGRVRPG